MCQTGRKPWHQTPFRLSYSHSTHPEFTRDFSQPVCGEREASLSNGNTRPLLRFFIKRRIVLIAMQQSITEGFRPCCSLRQIIAENDRAPPQQLLRGRRDASRRTAWVFARRDQQSTCCSSCVDRKNSRTGWDPPPPVHALHRSPESGMTPSNEGCLWWVMLLIARFDVPEKMLNGIHHQFHEDLASELACGRMTASTRNGLTSLRGRGKDTYYHRFREVSSLRL